MKTVNHNEFLFPLRKRRDELAEELLREECSEQREASIHGAMKGNLAPFKAHFMRLVEIEEEDNDDFFEWRSDRHEEFYNVCSVIKELEAKLYDQAMKGTL